MSGPFESAFREMLDEADAAGLRRRLTLQPKAGIRRIENGRTVLNFSSNDYLDLARHPVVLASAREALAVEGAGATASRLMTGHLPCHEALERELAAFKGYPAALAFSSGFAANLGILPALVGRGDYVCADRLIHASLIDGLRLSGARCVRFPHNDAGRAADLLARAPAGARKLVVTESVFSMDGDRAPLKALAEIAANAGASLYVDEAHATGTIGPGGRGGIAEAGLGPDTVAFAMGTLSKALGSAGGYLACAPVIRDGLVQSSRSMIYSTGLPPPVAGAVLGALKVLRAKPERAAELQARAERFRTRLKEAGLNTGASSTHIVPVIAGGTGRAISLATRLRAEGILAVPIRPPTVPAGTARIRFSISWGHTAEELDYTADTVIRAAREEGWW